MISAVAVVSRALILPPQLLLSRLIAPPRRCFLCCSATAGSSSDLQPPDVSLLAETARITLSLQEVEVFSPKIREVVDWFGQLQAVNLESFEPALRADTEGDAKLREDSPEIFENRDAIIAAIPKYDDPYVKVPKVLNME